jgi:hypothetical protein
MEYLFRWKAMGKTGESEIVDTEDTFDMQNDCLA